MSLASKAGITAPVASGDSPPHGSGAGAGVPRRSPPRIPRSNRPFQHADPATAGPYSSSNSAAQPSNLKSSPRSHRRVRRSAGGRPVSYNAAPTAAFATANAPPAHPFTDNSNKINFPGFDAALFGSTTGTCNDAPSSSSDSPPRSDINANNNASSSSADNSSKTNDNSPGRETDCSFASSNNLNNFSLDLSIGARAALAEHRRHVARYGIDGDADEVHRHRPPVDSVHHPGTPHSGGTPGGGGTSDRSSLSTLRGSPGEGGTKSNSGSGSGISKSNSSPNKHSPPRGDWERFNDGSTHVSFASTFIVHGGDIDDDDDDSNELHNVSNVMLGRSFLSDASHDRSREELKGGCGNEDADSDDDGNSSSADNSPNRSDYFNSSRVHLLATPERNKPIVDEASRRARELAHEDGSGTFAGGNGARHHVMGRGNALDDEDDRFEDTGSSFIGVDDSTVGGSTVVGDVSAGMAYLFREAMRLNASAATNDNDDTQIDISADPDMEYSENEEGVGDFDEGSRVKVYTESHPSKTLASSSANFRNQNGSHGSSKGESFVECEGGIEFVADISDILHGSAAHTSSTQTPSRKSRGSPGTSSGSGSGYSNQKLPTDSFSTPRRGSPRRRVRQASPKYSSPNKSFGRDKENAEDFNLIALSPIASKAGSEAAKLLSAESVRYGGTGGNMAKGGTPPRTPLREFGSPRKHRVGATVSARMVATNGGLAPTPERGELTMSSFLNDSNLSVSMIEGNDQSLLSTYGISPLRGTNEDTETTPDRLMRSNSFDSPGATERRRRRTCTGTSSEGKARSCSVDSPGRRAHSDLLPRRVVKSLGARYSQPDRFEDNFSPISATQDSTELKSVSRSLLQSFEA